MKIQFDKEKKLEKGMTLVEMLVAIFVFSIVVGAISGLFISSIRAQRHALASQQLLNEVSYTLEYMSRALRMAIKQGKQVGPGCTSFIDGVNYEITQGGQGLMFINVLEKDATGNPYCQEFFLGADGKLKKKNWTTGEELNLTSDKLKIDPLKFFLTGDGSSDNLQPKVTILLEIEGISQGTGGVPKIRIQTTVSQRNLDI